MTYSVFLYPSDKIHHKITVAGCDFAVVIACGDGGGHIAKCPILGLDIKGDTADEAYHRIIWTVTFFFEAGLELGNLQKELAALNADPELFAEVRDYYADREFKYLVEDDTDYYVPRIHKTITVAGCEFAVEIFAENSGIYVADCPVLRVATQADNVTGAYDNIIEAVTLFLDATWDLGELQQELERRSVDSAIWEKVSKYYIAMRGKTVTSKSPLSVEL